MPDTPDWNAIKAEYITTSVSYRALSSAWGVSFRTLCERAKREKWPQRRKKHRDGMVAKTVRNVETKTVRRNTDRLINLRNAADGMGEVIAELVRDVQRLRVRSSASQEDGENKIDTKAIRELTGALKDLTLVVRNLYDLPTKQEKAAMHIASQRLALDRQKANTGGTDEGETGVVEIAPMMQEEENEP